MEGTGRFAALERLLLPWEKWFDPEFLNMDRIPGDARPLLFVGNHTTYGLVDIPHFYMAVWRQKGLYLRGMGDHFHFRVPLWGRFLGLWGAVDGTRENCARLMQAGESVLVFPGGAREVAKRKGEDYQLIWKQRIGFARLAIEHGCTVVPFAQLGGDEAWKILLDAHDLRSSPLGGAVEAAYRLFRIPTDSMMPLALPRPARLYFSVGEPISTAPWAGRASDDEAAWALRERVAAAIEGQLAYLRGHRDRDPRRRALPRLLRQLVLYLREVEARQER